MPINFNIKEYSKNKKIYIETGFYYGESALKAFDSGFEQVYSCDINEKFVENGKKIFADKIAKNEFFIFHGRSTDILKTILENLEHEAVFFLDAHDLNYEDTKKEEWDIKDECPIIEELDLIKNHKIKNHTIIVDDLRMFGYGCAPGTWAYKKNINPKKIYNKLKEINENYNFAIEDGICEKDILVAFIR